MATEPQRVVLLDDAGAAQATVQQDSTLPPSGLATGVVLQGALSGTTAKLILCDVDGNLVSIQKQGDFGPTSSGSIPANSSGNVDVTTNYVHQLLNLLEVRVNTTPNNFDISIYKDSGRTKRIYYVTGITTQEYVDKQIQPMYLVDSKMYITIANNRNAARTFTIEGTIEVRI